MALFKILRGTKDSFNLNPSEDTNSNKTGPSDELHDGWAYVVDEKLEHEKILDDSTTIKIHEGTMYVDVFDQNTNGNLSNGRRLKLGSHADKADNDGSDNKIVTTYLSKLFEVDTNINTSYTKKDNFQFTGSSPEGEDPITPVVIPLHSADVAGLITPNAQTITGNKTFANHLILQSAFYPNTTETITLGDKDHIWKEAYAKEFIGDLKGKADAADKLTTPNTGSATQPIFFENGKPTAIKHTLEKSVPSNAVFTDTTYTFAAGAGFGELNITPSGGDKQTVTIKVGGGDFLPLTGGTLTGPTVFNSGATATLKSKLIINGNQICGEVLPSNPEEGQVFFQLLDGDVGGDTGGGGGVPKGGLKDQIIIKNSSKDYDASWATPNGQFWNISAAKLGIVTVGGRTQNFYLENGAPAIGDSFVPVTGGNFTGNITVRNDQGQGLMGVDKTDTNAGSIWLFSDNETTGNRGIAGLDHNTTLVKNLLSFDQSGYAYTQRLYGAVWNDYAEYRKSDITEPGRVVFENGDDTLSLSTERLQRGCEIISDTFGFAIGETDECKTPIAASGRVLAYPLESREEFTSHIGWPVCSGPNGTVSLMTKEEEEKYPSRIIGIVSAVPDYEEWGSGKVKVNGRVWIRVK